MGFLRLLLATIVLASHCHVAQGHTGVIAVECFFVISGFYMQMLLHEQYAPHINDKPSSLTWWQKFYISRLLRIFIPYWTVLLVIILISLLRGRYEPFLALMHHPFSGSTLGIIFSNLFIVGSEHIKLMRAVHGCGTVYWNSLLIGPIWSVGIELMFYAMAPVVLLCRSSLLWVITIACAIGKVMILHKYYIPFTFECGDSFLNGIFALEIGVFTTGALGYRFYVRHLAQKPLANALQQYKRALGVVVAATTVFVLIFHYGRHSPLALITAACSYVIFVMIATPFLFHISRNIKKDRLAGELSYSFYLCHVYIITNLPWHLPRVPKFLVCEAITLCCAYVINRYIEKPLDKIRHTYFR